MKKIALVAAGSVFFIGTFFSLVIMLPLSVGAISVPAAPTNVTAVPGNGSALVSFTPDPVNCGFGCTYTVTTQVPAPLLSIPDVTGTSSSIQVSGLTNGVGYTFTVTATDGAGTSPASSSSAAVTPVAGTMSGATVGATAGTMSGATTAAVSSTTASSTNPAISFNVPNPLGSNTADLNTLVANILKAMVLLLTPVVTIMLLYSGFLFVTAQGNEEGLTKAKNALMYTLIGAAIVLGAQGLELVVSNTVTCLVSSTTGC